MNLGFLSRPSRSVSTTAFNNLWRLPFRKDETFNIKPLTSPFLPPIDGSDEPLLVSFNVHFVAGGPSALCDKMYSDNIGCVECEKTNKFGGQNYPTKVLCFIGYVYDLVGKTRKSSRTGREFEENPVKVIEIPGGKEKVNWTPFKMHHSDGDFMDSIWRVTRQDAGIFYSATITEKKLGQQYDPEVPSDILEEYSSKTDAQAVSLCLSAYGNVKWNHPDLVNDGILPPAPLAEDTLNKNSSEALDD